MGKESVHFFSSPYKIETDSDQIWVETPFQSNIITTSIEPNGLDQYRNVTTDRDNNIYNKNPYLRSNTRLQLGRLTPTANKQIKEQKQTQIS